MIDTIILLFTSAIQAAFILAVFLAMFAVMVSILALVAFIGGRVFIAISDWCERQFDKRD